MLNYSGYIFDLDGTIYLGDQMIEGSSEVIATLLKRNKKVLFLTNKTIESRQKYVEKLNRFGIPIDLNHVISPTIVTIKYIKERFGNACVYVIGEDIIKQEFKEAGFTFSKIPEETEVVVVSWDRDFHYEHLNFAYQAVHRGAVCIATNPDRTCPIVGGNIPDCGSMIGAVEGATGKKFDAIIGKPSRLTASYALGVMNLKAEQCLMLGDRLETDIMMGNHAGMDTGLVLTGVSSREDMLHSKHQPKYVLNSVFDLLKVGE